MNSFFANPLIHLHECPSPDSSGNPFILGFRTKDWERIAGLAPD